MVGRLADVGSRVTTKLRQSSGRELSGEFYALLYAFEIGTDALSGDFSEVHKAVHKPTGNLVALKRILMHNEKEGMPVTALREIKILKALKHPCVVEILDMFVVRSKVAPCWE